MFAEGDNMFRIGQSIDIHQLVEGRDLYIGGVKIDHDKGLLGHSDADVLLHAIIESIIGALGLGDIGKHFPDTDPQYKGISSMVLLEHCYQLMNQEGYEINNLDSIIMCEAPILDEKGYGVGNIDAVIIAQKPKMAPHIQKMRENVASKLHCDVSQINIKATRGEKLGFVGRQEGMVAQAVVLLRKKGV